MKKLLLLQLQLLTALGLLVGCAPMRREWLSYQNGASQAEIRVTVNGLTYSAQLTLGDMGEGCPRDAVLIYTAPETLYGLCVTRKNGVCRTTVGGVVSDGGEEYLRVCELFSLDGTVSKSGTEVIEGEKSTYILVVGERGNATVYFNREGAPMRIVTEDITVDVVWFEGQ